MFMTRIEVLQENPLDSLILMLGDCRIEEGVPASKVIRFPDVSAETVSSIGAINMMEYKNGIILLVSCELVETQYKKVRRVQKYLIYCYTKYFWFQSHDTFVPDPLQTGHDKGKYAHLPYYVACLENLSYLLSFPRAKNLVGVVPSFPVLILAPGNSLQGIAPHIKELSKRFLIICLSKALEFCRINGVVPDIVVQLDTHGEQANFYTDEMDFSQSWLFALSCSQLRKYIHLFAGVFWIDSFESTAYGDNYELRSSWLSSLIPMLGVAELMKPPILCVAGSDLAYTNQPVIAFTSEGPKETLKLLASSELVYPRGGIFGTRLNDGTVGNTTLQFLATAYEAESIVSEFALNLGTLAFSLSHSGILDPEVFEMACPSDFEGMGAINRRLFHATMRQATQSGGLPDPMIIKQLLSARLKEADVLVRQANMLAYMDDPKALMDNPLLSAGKLISHLHPLPDLSSQLYLSTKIIEKYRKLLQRRSTEFRLADWADRGKEVAVLCYPDEVEAIKSSLSDRFPKGRWNFRHTWARGMAPVENPLAVRNVPQFLHDRPVTLISARYAEAADYLLPLLPQDKVLIVEQLLSEPRMPPA